MRRFAFVSTLSFFLGLSAVAGSAPLAAQTVKAVLFHSPTCPHCRQVISQDLPVFFQVYGGEPRVTEQAHLAMVSNGQLEILFVDASQPAGTRLYQASLDAYPVTPDRLGVPRLIVDDSVLVGSAEIPNRLHAIIRKGLAAGGVDWPGIRGITEAAATFLRAGRADTAGAMSVSPPPARSPATTPPPAGTPRPAGAVGGDTAGMGGESGGEHPVDSAAPQSRVADLGSARPSTLGERFGRDPVGNGLAVVALVVMVAALGAILVGAARRLGPREPGLWMPALLVIGAAVSAYLTYIETTGTAAVCGPVGDCNTVQQSPYATLFGVIPVGLLGLLGYGLMLALWVLGLEGRPAAGFARRALVVATLAGLAFSVYLTFLEPFVIGATCLWCLSSAAVVTALAWLAAAWTSHPPR
jgi:uncharacterized membrane protein